MSNRCSLDTAMKFANGLEDRQASLAIFEAAQTAAESQEVIIEGLMSILETGEAPK